MENDDVAFRRSRKVKVVLMVEALLNLGALWIAVGEMLRRALFDLVVNLHDLCALLNSAARVEKQENLQFNVQ